MTDLKCWIRIGDNAEYEGYDTPHEAGYQVGFTLAGIRGDTPKPRYSNLGMELDGFTGNNCISLFWGDADAQDSIELNASDKLDFERGLQEGYSG